MAAVILPLIPFDAFQGAIITDFVGLALALGCFSFNLGSYEP